MSEQVQWGGDQGRGTQGQEGGESRPGVGEPGSEG